MFLESREYHCLCCLGLHCVDVRFDKFGRPYTVCLLCSARTFVRTREALSGMAILGEMIPALVARAQREAGFAAQLAQTRDAFMARLVARSAAVPAARESGAQPAVAPAAKEQVA